MKIGPKFKIAKRLNAPVFEKTQTQKFALSQARSQPGGNRRRPGQMSDYKRQLLEKQKLRYSYGITERQLRRYVDESLGASTTPPATLLTTRLESRLDNIVYRLGLAKTRRFARQMVSHGHVTVNGTRSTIPSQTVRVGDVIAVREGSKQSGLFTNFTDTHEPTAVPSWLSFDAKKLAANVTGTPTVSASDTLFDIDQVLEFYSR
jgi:ribosomal protein S4, bacterial/organelle type